MAKYNITELKHHLGTGLGLRKNRYMIEIPVPGISGEKINILCQSASFPERNLIPSVLWHKGRSYIIRGETDYGNEYELTFVDNSSMDVRRFFDTWVTQIDDTNLPNTGILGSSFEVMAPGLLDTLTAGLDLVNTVKNVVQNPRQLIDFAIGQIDPSKSNATATYQTDINIWQMNHAYEPVYGYKLQNAFPKRVGSISFGDDDENTLTEFTVVFGFSEFVPIHNTVEDLTRAAIGDQATNLLNGIINL